MEKYLSLERMGDFGVIVDHWVIGSLFMAENNILSSTWIE